MNPQAILDKIDEDARATAAQIVSDASEKVSAAQRETKRRIEAMHESTLKQADREQEELAQRMRRMAQLEGRKELLAKKRVLMDRAFALAAEKLGAMDAEKARAFFISQTASAASGGETVMLGENNANFARGNLIGSLNAAMQGAGKPGNLTLASEKRPSVTGIVLKTGGAEIHITFEAMLSSLRADLETEVAAVLFTES